MTISDSDQTDVVAAAVDSVVVTGTGVGSVPGTLTNAILESFLTVSPTAILDGTESTDLLTWNFNSGSEAFNFLDVGETLILTYTVSVTDDDGTPLSDSETVVVTITGNADAPVLTTNNPLTVPEDATRTITSAYLASTDVDTDPTQIVYELTSLPGGDADVRLNGSNLAIGGTFTQDDIDNNRVRFRFDEDAFAATFGFTVSDGTNTSSVYTFSVNGAPVNDAPVVVAPGAALNATEQVGLAIHGTGFGVTDVDEAGSGATATFNVGEGIINVLTGNSGVTITGGNGSGSVTLNGTIAQINSLLTGSSTGTITYLNNSDTPGNSTTFTVTVNDNGNTGSDPGLTGDAFSEEGTNSQTINITDVNDSPVISGGPDTSSQTETNSGLSDSGTLIVTDVDTSDVVTAAVDSVAVSGTGAGSVPGTLTNAILESFLTVNPTAILDGTETTDTLTWDFNSGSEAFDFLATGETLILTYTVSATDDDGIPLTDTETVTVTITGTNDAPVITGGPDTSALTETDSGLTDSGTLTVADADLTDLVTAAVDSVVVTGTGATSVPGTLTNAILQSFLTVTPTAILDGTELTDSLTWNFNSGSEAFDFLADGETLILTYTVSATDDNGTPLSDTETVTVTITGTNDAPTITAVDVAGAVVEDASTPNLTDSGSVNFADLDETD